MDKLLNYIRYWQASGESIKTSIRTKTRLAQIVQEGRFRGGCAPYGYKLVKNGRTGKKNRELYDIAVEPTEAVTVQKIFELSDRYGYGGRKISSSLVEEGIVNMRTGEPFHYSSIQNILRNIMDKTESTPRARYFEELTCILKRDGFEPQPPDGDALPIYYGGEPLCNATENGIRYFSADVNSAEKEKARDCVADTVTCVKEYMRTCQSRNVIVRPFTFILTASALRWKKTRLATVP